MHDKLPEDKKPIYRPTQRIYQISESHCGPAVIQMLLGHLNIEVTQDQVADAGGACETIEEHGMRVEQLAQAVREMRPDVQFWYKRNAKLSELATVVMTYGYPAGVEWQGLFEASEAEESDDGDYGHFSIVTYVDEENQQVIIADPYKDFYTQDRIFSFEFFNRRWWDTNEVIDAKTGRPKYVEDYHMMFIITPKDELFPRTLKMRKG